MKLNIVQRSLLFASLLTGLSASHLLAEWNPEWEEGRLQLELADGFDISDINNTYSTTTSDELHPLYLLYANTDSYPELLEQLNLDPRVVWAEPSYLDQTPEAVLQMIVIVVGETASDFHDQNVYDRIGLGVIHPYLDGSGTTVAIIDTGVNSDHETLVGSVLPGIDFVDQDDDANDSANGIDDDWDGQTDEGAGHGTMVAGIVHLTAPGAMLLPIRSLDDEGRGISFNVAKGIRYAVDQGADIINMSFGLHSRCETIEHEVAAAEAAGVVLIAAAGNDGAENPPYFPALDERVVSVAALDSYDVKADFSNFHSTVGTSSPGVGILAPFHNGKYALGEGTSFAAPFVAGQAALVLEGTPGADKATVETIVQNGVINIYDTAGNESYVGKLGTGRFDGAQTWSIIQPLTSVDGETVSGNSGWISSQPNPARLGETVSVFWKLPFADSDSAPAHAFVLDAQGRKIKELVVGTSASGELHTSWNGMDRAGRSAPSGVYFVQMDRRGESAGTRVVRVD